MKILKIYIVIILLLSSFYTFAQRIDFDKITSNPNFDDTIKQLWTKCKPNILSLVNTAGIKSYNLYEIQIKTNVLLKYAFIKNDYKLIDELLTLYLKLIPKLKTVNSYTFIYFDNEGKDKDKVLKLEQPYKMWIDATNSEKNYPEKILYVSQFLAMISDAIFNVALIPEKNRSKTMYLFAAKYAEILDSHYKRWIIGVDGWDTVSGEFFKKVGPFQRRGWECKYNNEFIPTRLTHYQLIDLLHDFKCGNGNSPKYCNSITDTDLWIIAGINSYVAAYNIDPDLVKVISNYEFYQYDYIPKANELILSRISTTILSNFDGETVWGADFDNGTRDDHPDYIFSGYDNPNNFPSQNNISPSKNVGWDLSHARRFVNVFNTLFQTKEYLELDFPGENIIKMFANQFAYKIFNRDFEYPLFSNFFDGTNGWYRVEYSKRKNFGYGPNDLSITALTGGILFWSYFNNDLRKIGNSLYALLHTSDPQKRNFLNQHYEKNHWSNDPNTNLPKRIQSQFFVNQTLENNHTSTNFTLLSFYASIAIPIKKSQQKELFLDNVSIYPNPAKEHAFVLSENKITEINLFDLTGILIYKTSCNNTIIHLPLSGINQGTYLVVIKDEFNNLYNKKLIIN